MLEKNVEDLQVQVAYLEATVAELNEVVAKQDQRMMVFEKQLKHLNEMIKRSGDVDDAANAPPPHY